MKKSIIILKLLLCTFFAYSQETWYSYKSGDWDDAGSWTLDGASLPIYDNPGGDTPDADDDIVITSGRTITVQNDTDLPDFTGSLTIYGTLNFGTSDGNNTDDTDLIDSERYVFAQILGDGTIEFYGYDNTGVFYDNLPSSENSNWSNFEGVIVAKGGNNIYINQEWTSTNTSALYEFKVDMDETADEVVFLEDVEISNNLQVDKGTLRINQNTNEFGGSSEGKQLDILISGSVTISSDGEFNAGSGAIYASGNSSTYHGDWHTVTVGGDFTNNGSIDFSPGLVVGSVDYYDTDDAAVSLYFTGASDNSFLVNSSTILYNLIIDKGTDRTYQLSLNVANTPDDLYILGSNDGAVDRDVQDPEVKKNIYIKAGTLSLEGKTYIRSLGEESGASEDIFVLGESAGLELNGADVQLDFSNSATGQSMYIIGELTVNEGLLDSKGSIACFIGNTGSFTVNGGTVKLGQLRPTSYTSDAVISFSQTGGTILFEDGTHDGHVNETYAVLDLSGTNYSVNLLGGEIYFERTKSANSGNSAFKGGTAINVDVDVTKYNVSKDHKITLSMTDASDVAFGIVSNIPLGEFVIEETQGLGVSLQSDLELMGDLHIQKDILDAQTYTLTLNGSMTVEDGTDIGYDASANTTIFQGTEDAQLALYHHHDADMQLFKNLQINKEGATLSLYGDETKDDVESWNSNLIQTASDGAFELLAGTLDLREFSAYLLGDITNYGTLGIYDADDPEHDNVAALVKFRGTNGSYGYNTINTIEGANFGNVRMNSETEVIRFTSDVHIDRLEYKHGRLELGTYKLEVDELVEDVNGGAPLDETDWQEKDMMLVAGNASDGGLSIKVTSDGTYRFPLGINLDPTDDEGDGKYTPLEIKLENVTSEGYVTVSIADEYLQTVQQSIGATELLSYYWRVDYSGFDDGASLPNVEYVKLTANNEDSNDDTGTNASGYGWIPGRVLDVDPFTREDGSGISPAISGNEIIYGSDGNEFELDKANYTAGLASKFTGSVEIYYSYTSSGVWVDFNNSSNWSTVSHTDPTNATNDYPKEGDVAIIGSTHLGGGTGRVQMRSDVDVNVASLIFDSQDGAGPLNAQGLSRLRMQTSSSKTTAYIGQLSGIGEITLDIGRAVGDATVEGDVGDFAEQDSSGWFYWIQVDNEDLTISNRSVFPGLRFFGSSAITNTTVTFDQPIFAKSLLVDKNSIFRITNDVEIEDDVEIGDNELGNIVIANTGSDITVDIGGYLQLDDGSTFTVEDAGSSEHLLKIGGDLIFVNAGSFDLNTGNSNAVLELTGSNDAEFITSNISPDLYRIKVSKDTGKSFTWGQSINSLTSASNGSNDSKPIVVESGKFVLDNSSIDYTLSSGGDDYYIPSGGELELAAGVLRIDGSSNGLSLDGTLTVSGGDFLLEGSNSYIEYTSSGNASINISDGNLLVGGYVRGASTNENEGILNYNQTGGNFVVGFNANSSSTTNGNWAAFDLDNTSTFNLDGASSKFIIADVYNNDEALHLSESITLSQSGDAVIEFGYEDVDFDGTGIDVSTAASNTTFKINTSKDLTNIKLNSHSSLSGLKLLVETGSKDLNLSGDLEVSTGTTFEIEDSRALTLEGNLINNGTVSTADNTTVTFAGSSDQSLSGSGTSSFYDLVHSGSSDLSFSHDITVSNDLQNLAGSLTTTGVTLDLDGDIQMDGSQVHSDNTGGILFSGTTAQQINGTGTFARLHINNNSGVEIPDDNGDITIDGVLVLESGIFNVNQNLLILAENTSVVDESGTTNFSETNMISTNGSELDKGVRKIFPASFNTNYIFPIGRDDASAKYTPIQVLFENNGSLERTGSDAGWITVKAENQMIATISNDTEVSPVPEFDDTQNVLQYYWVLTSSGLSISKPDQDAGDLDDVQIEFSYLGTDALVSSTDDMSYTFNVADHYVAALLSTSSVTWDKQYGGVDDSNDNFTWEYKDGEGDETISGYYTAGVGNDKDNIAGNGVDELFTGTNGAINDDLPIFITKQSGNYSDINTWDTGVSTGSVADGVGPVGGIIIIDANDEVTVDESIRVLKTYIHENGVLIFDETPGNRLGAVSGAVTNAASLIGSSSADIPNGVPGTFKFYIENNNGLIMPSYYWSNPDDVDDDCDVNFEFTGTANYNVPIYKARSINVDVGTTNTLTLPDNTLEICEDLVLTNGILDQNSAQNIEVQGSFETKNASVLDLESGVAFNVSNDFTHNATTDIVLDNSSSLTVGGNLVVGAGATLTANANVSSFYIQGNTTLSGELSIDNGNEIDLDGNLTLQSTGTLTGASTSSTIELEGDLSNNSGTFNLGDSYLELDGSSSQSISGISSLNYLKLNNTGSGASLSSDITVSQELDFTDGVLSTSAKLIFADETVIVNGSQDSYVDGQVEVTINSTSNYVRLPIGGSSSYRPIEIKPDDISGQAWTVKYLNSSPEDVTSDLEDTELSSLVEFGYYEVYTETLEDSAFISIPWDTSNGIDWGVSETILDDDDLRMADVDANGLPAWTARDISKTGTSSSGNIQYSSSYKFEASGAYYFTLGVNDGTNETLPVSMIYFNAARTNSNAVSLQWMTASEIDNKGFYVERSRDGINFENIGWVDGQGYSDLQVQYSFVDVNPGNGQVVYRLRQVNFGGFIEADYYANVEASNAEVNVKVYPNPLHSADQLKLVYSGLSINADADLELRSGNGTLIKHMELTSDSDGVIREMLDMNLNTGLYLVSLRINGRVYTKRIIVN
ncbi:T9SS type A sorting domain-containing protein [Sediminitomix flava]|uniref:Putative secreted protein (Por secretion system target) n=1 Tax=Sediminitomix flava TaxID=379075 RepID=A0A315ZZC4_SEDFL|nr:T9SS type A sorting domain-containing protein [Sediminitomix flava]PWJ42717.1 putative secreted protein (Por secretion system target) [Sediminitomix flava]